MYYFFNIVISLIAAAAFTCAYFVIAMAPTVMQEICGLLFAIVGVVCVCSLALTHGIHAHTKQLGELLGKVKAVKRPAITSDDRANAVAKIALRKAS